MIQKQIILTILLMLGLRQLSFAQDKLSGYYSSNFAIGGYVKKDLQLKDDKTFKYEVSGCMGAYKATGIYKIQGDTILLSYASYKKDTSVLYLFSSPADTALNVKRLLIKKMGLFLFDKNGKIKSKEIEKYTKKFVFFGKRIPRTKKYFLQKTDKEKITAGL